MATPKENPEVARPQYMSSAYRKEDVVFSMRFDFETLQGHRVSMPTALRPYMLHDIMWNQFIDNVCRLFDRVPLPFYLALGSLFCDVEEEYAKPRYEGLLTFFREQKVLFQTLGLDIIYDPHVNRVVFVKVPKRELNAWEHTIMNKLMDDSVSTVNQGYMKRLGDTVRSIAKKEIAAAGAWVDVANETTGSLPEGGLSRGSPVHPQMGMVRSESEEPANVPVNDEAVTDTDTLHGEEGDTFSVSSSEEGESEENGETSLVTPNDQRE